MYELGPGESSPFEHPTIFVRDFRVVVLLVSGVGLYCPGPGVVSGASFCFLLATENLCAQGVGNSSLKALSAASTLMAGVLEAGAVTLLRTADPKCFTGLSDRSCDVIEACDDGGRWMGEGGGGRGPLEGVWKPC